MKRKDQFLLHLLPMTLAAALVAVPALAQSSGSTSGITTPGITAATPLPGTSAGTAAVAWPAGSVVMHRPRLSQLMGTNVYNDRNEAIGEVDDVIIASPAGTGTGTTMPGTATSSGAMQGPVAIIQVGGFLGMGGRLVAVPLGELQWNVERERIVMPNASKETLQGRPAFSYDTLRRG
jgi:hypothetical protein